MDQEQIEYSKSSASRVRSMAGGLIGTVRSRCCSLLVTKTSDRSMPDDATAWPTSSLVPVHLGGVDVAVPDLEGRGGGGLGVRRRDLEHPEPQLRDGPAVVQRQLGDRPGSGVSGGHGRLSSWVRPY